MGMVKSIIQNEGLKGLFKGMVSMIYREVIYTTIHYTSYRYLKDEIFSFTKETPSLSFVPSFIAGVTALVISHPLEVVRSRL